MADASGNLAGSGGKPVLSLAMPVYNGEKFIVAALDSVLAQDFTDWDLLVCDNASTDATSAIVAEYVARDPRVRYVRHERNLGAAGNHNYGFHNTSGELFAWVHSDNVYEPGYFKECVAELAHHPEASCVHTTVVDIDERGERIRRWEDEPRTGHPDVAVRFRDLTELDHMCWAWFGVARRETLRQTSLHASFDSADRLEIVELALRGPIRVVEQDLFLHREHPGRIMRQAATARARYLVLDPEWSGRIPFPVLNIGRQYIAAVLRAPISPRDKIRCLARMRGWVKTNWLRVIRTVARGLFEYAKLAVRSVTRR